MTISEKINKIKEVWIKGSIQFDFKIITPFEVNIDGKKKQLFALIPGYGAKNGTIIFLVESLLTSVDKEIIEWAKQNKYHLSIMPLSGNLDYDEKYINDCLEDWGEAK